MLILWLVTLTGMLLAFYRVCDVVFCTIVNNNWCGERLHSLESRLPPLYRPCLGPSIQQDLPRASRRGACESRPAHRQYPTWLSSALSCNPCVTPERCRGHPLPNPIVTRYLKSYVRNHSVFRPLYLSPAVISYMRSSRRPDPDQSDPWSRHNPSISQAISERANRNLLYKIRNSIG